MSHQDLGSRLLGLMAAALLFAACTSPSSTASAAASPAAPAAPAAPATPAPTPAPATALVRGLPDFSQLVEQVGGAVVNVTVSEKPAVASVPGGAEDPFSDFFRQFGIPRNIPHDNAPVRGEGSGFIVSADGYILTNAHVVSNASKVTVKLTDRREFEAKVIGADQRTDVAVIKIDARNLPTVRIGDPARLKVGEWVVAIGSPFGFENSVTAGIVSGKFRSLPGEDNRNYVPFIQTDAAVNPGNSGGPLFNVSGEVVGINSQIYSNTQSYAGLSFAIPIDIANNVREQLVKSGHVSRGRIGVAIQEVNALLAENLGLDRPRGAAVSSVDGGGPADKAGVKPEDVILSVNGQPVDTSGQLPTLIAALHPGSTATLEVWRDRAIRKLTVTIGEMPEPKNTAALRGPRHGGGDEAGDAIARLGVVVRALSADERAQLHVSGSLVVVSVQATAAEDGVQEGDVILGVNRTKVNSIGELQAAIKASGRTAALLLQSNAGEGRYETRIVPVRLQ